MTAKAIREGQPYEDVHKFISKVHQSHKRKDDQDADLLSPDSIAAIATGRPPPGKPSYWFLGQIVSGDFDADRMDYLLRDPMHIGLGAGEVDVWSIIHNFILIPETIGGESFWVLKLHPQAALSAENLLAVRDLAYRRVYYHATHRAATELMLRAMHYLCGEPTSKLRQEEVLKMTDDVLLHEFSNGTAFTKGVADRIRLRNLYEPLPFEINVRDLSEKARKRIALLAGPKALDRLTYDEWLDIEADAAKSVGLPAHETVIFDIQATPIAGRGAYTDKVFYDENLPDGEEDRSLLDTMPHLRLTHGKSSVAGEDEDLHERYSEEVSRLLVFVPGTLFEVGVSDALRELHEKDRQTLAAVGDDEFQAAIARAFQARFKPIIDAFLKFIYADDDDKQRGGLESEVASFLTNLVKSRLATD